MKNGFTTGTSTSNSKNRALERVDTESWILTVSFYKGVDIDVGAKVEVLTYFPTVTNLGVASADY